MIRVLFLVLGAVLLAGATTVPEKRLPDPEQEARAQDIMAEIRCLVCQSESIANSNADLAADLRQVVRERVVAGDSKAEVKTYLQDRYGDWVLLEPPFKTTTVLLWLAPVLFLAIGAAIIFVGARRRLQRYSDSPDIDESDEPA